MPFFGKKENKNEKSEKGPPKPLYPTQAGAGSSYPRQASGVTGAPPPYSEVAPGGVAQGPHPPAMINVVSPHGGTTVQIQASVGTYDAGARFGGAAQPNIPPPPPGVIPNQQQILASQGHSVSVQQRQETFMGGTGDGGYTIW